MNKLKVRNNIILLAYILIQLIINNKFLLAHTTETNFQTTVEQVTTWRSPCYSNENITCACNDDGGLFCRIIDALNDVYISFKSNPQYLLVMCSTDTETNINFILERELKTILPKTRYLKVFYCKNFKHEIYMNDKVREIFVKMNHMTKTKVTLVYNIDLPVETTKEIDGIHDLQLIIKSNRDEIQEADIISVVPDIFSKQNQLETFTLSVQGLRNQYLSLQNLTPTFFKNFTTLKELDLAGNNMKTLDANIFAELTQLNCLNLSRNEIRELSESLFVYQRQLSILDLSHNLLTHLPLDTTFGYGNVSQLNASYNKITGISVSQLPTNLTVLDLRNNRIKSLNAEFLRTYLNDSKKLQFLYLSGNPWICDCSTQQLLYTIRTHRTRIPDVDQLLCVNKPNDTFLIANVRELCPTPINVDYQHSNGAVISIALTIITLLCIIALLYKCKLKVEVESELDKHETFDPFNLYAHQNANFVNHTSIIPPQLEQCEAPFCVCTHECDWLADAHIPDPCEEPLSGCTHECDWLADDHISDQNCEE